MVKIVGVLNLIAGVLCLVESLTITYFEFFGTHGTGQGMVAVIFLFPVFLVVTIDGILLVRAQHPNKLIGIPMAVLTTLLITLLIWGEVIPMVQGIRIGYRSVRDIGGFVLLVMFITCLSYSAYYLLRGNPHPRV